MHNDPISDGTGDACNSGMRAAMQAKVRSIFTREFYRRGRLTWDMKMALRCAFTGR